jgi:hypothetical protein
MTETGFSVPSDKAGRIALPLPNDPVTGLPNRLIDAAEPKNDSAGVAIGRMRSPRWSVVISSTVV